MNCSNAEFFRVLELGKYCNQSEEQEGASRGIRSDAEASSLNKGENKSYQARADQPQAQGLYLSLPTAQAYSIMKNIPPEFRLLEKNYLKKVSSRRRPRAEAPFRNNAKINITAKSRSRRQRETKNTKGYISSELLDQMDYMVHPENLDASVSLSRRGSTISKRGPARSEVARISTDLKKNIEPSTPRETLDEEKANLDKANMRNGYDKFNKTDDKTTHEELPVSQMKIKLDPVEDEGSLEIKGREIQNPDECLRKSLLSKNLPSQQNIPTPINTANLNMTKEASETHQNRLKAEEEPLSEGDNHFSTQAILSAFSVKSEKLFATLNEVVTNHC